MPDLNTKQRILRASIQLFNQHGMGNVRLQQIANEVDISVGNLAYHYKNKDVIIEALNDLLYHKAAKILTYFRIYPNFLDFDNQLLKYVQFIEKYPFYFLDLLEIKRHYPALYPARRMQINKMINQIKMRFEYHMERGAIHSGVPICEYDSNISAIWMTISHWLPQAALNGPIDSDLLTNFKKMVWGQFQPHFTEAGKAEYEMLVVPMLMNEYKRL